MSYENKAGLGVFNQYGPRETGGSIGLEHGENSTHVLNITLTPEFLNTGFVPPVVIPKGALFRSAILRVDEAFTLTGTCLLYTSPSPRDVEESRMPSSA